MAADIEIRSWDDDGTEQQSQQQSQKKRNENSTKEKISYSYNDIIILKDGRYGKIKFIGSLGYQSETWCGLILSTPTGSHNGIVNTRKYWVCKHNHGTFIKRSQIQNIKQQRIGPRFTIHDMVKTPKGKAFIRFIGALYYKHSIAEEEWYHENINKDKRIDDVMYGVELCDQMGTNSGSIDSQYYFTCPHYRGMFYKEKDITHITKDEIHNHKHKKIINNETLQELDEDSLSDSSSDDEFLTDDDIKRISLSANGTIDDRLSFARILSGFKHVQNANSRVRSIAKQYDAMTQKQRFSIEYKAISRKAQLAHDIINSARRQRAGTLPHKATNSSTYQAPRFADIIHSKHEAKSISNPGSPRTANKVKDRAQDGYPPIKPPLTSSHSTGNVLAKGSFDRITPKGKRGKRRKIQLDELGTSQETTLSLCDIDDVLSIYPVTLSPKESLNAPSHTITEEENIEQESPLHTAVNASSRDSIDNIMNDEDGIMNIVPFSHYKRSVNALKNSKTKASTKEPLTGITCDPAIGSDSSHSQSSQGYVSPGIISPGGGMSSLMLQDSASLDYDLDNVCRIRGNTNDNNKNNEKPFKLKAKPDSPFDVSSTTRDFQKVAEILMLECNNPKNLFKVLKGVVSKLRVSDAKYRRIDMMNSAVQNKLLRFEGAEEFLMLLGFKQIVNKSNIWYCDADQPPISVLDAATNVCNDCLLKCNHKRATLDMLKKFGKHHLHSHKKKRKKRKSRRRKKVVSQNKLNKLNKVKSMDSLDENVEISIRTRNGSIHVDGTVSGGEEDEKVQPKVSTPPNIEQNQISIRIDDSTEALSRFDDIKFEIELEGGDEDRFQLSDIVWSVTHKDNTDTAARAIILLCYPTFSDEYKLIKCLIERFFEPEASNQESASVTTESSMSISDSDTHSPKSRTITASSKFDFSASNYRIESLWEVQVKVISFLQQWMRTYWAEDWDQNDKLLDILGQFCVKTENCYKNDASLSDREVKGGIKLVKMVRQTMDVAGRTLTSLRKRATISGPGALPPKLDGLAGVGSAVNKLRYGFVKIDNTRLAEQITLLDFKYFKAIKKRECLGQSWKKSDKLTVAPNICALIDQFNKMSKWVQATVLLAKNVKTRGRLIKKFIKISYQLLTLRNFQSFCAFHLALSSAVIHKLSQAWTYVPAKHRARFEEMRVIFNTRNNMSNLRKLHREAHPPLIPYTGIFLSDLVGIEEGNKKYKDDGAINFANLMRLANSIDNILLFQRTQYEIESDITVQSLLLEDFKINAKLDADYIYRFSVDVAKKDLPLKKRSVLSIFASK